MPIVEMRTTYAGPGGVCNAGERMQVDSKTAKALFAGGYAVKPGSDKPKTPPNVSQETIDDAEAAAAEDAKPVPQSTTKSGPQ